MFGSMLPRSCKAALPAAMAGAAILAGVGAIVAASASCASEPDAARLTTILQPDYAAYRDFVDPYIQRRCGTLDCHGQLGRAYRVYGYTGLRLYNLDAGLVSGVQATRPEETLANYQAAVALEPEQMSRVVAKQGEDVDSLMLVRKPLRLERHKGGPAMSEDDPGYRCVRAWLRVRTVRRTADGVDFETIPPQEREPMSPTGKVACEEAQSFP